MNLEKKLLFEMQRIRAIEEEIALRYPLGKMRCPTHLSIGQEAAAVGVGLALRADDLAVGTHRSHAHYLAKGGNLKAMIAEIYGKETGCSRGRGGSMHLVDLSVGFEGTTAIVGNSIPIGVGLAFAAKLKKTNQVVCVFIGDGAIEEGVFFESANFAVLKQLPVLFFCENNLYSVYSPLSVRQPEGRKIHEFSAAIGLNISHGDGNNVETAYELSSSAINRIRQGSGPQFIELSTYRWLEHCGPNYDNHLGYRSEVEFKSWKERDPVEQYARKLISRNSISLVEFNENKQKIKEEIAEAFNFAENSSYPDSKEIFNDIYSRN